MFDDNVNIKVDNDNIYMKTNGMEGVMDVTIDTDNLEFLLIKENIYETPTKYINNIINKI